MKDDIAEHAKFKASLGTAIGMLSDLTDDLIGPDGSEEEFGTTLMMLTSYLLGTLMAGLSSSEEHLAKGLNVVGGIVVRTANECFAAPPERLN